MIVDLAAVEAYMEYIENYLAEEIWNFDETGLFFRAILDRTFALKENDCLSSKLSQEWLTALLACSSTGKSLI